MNDENIFAYIHKRTYGNEILKITYYGVSTLIQHEEKINFVMSFLKFFF